jgi:hypothetical protein
MSDKVKRYNYKGFSIVLELNNNNNKWYFTTEGSFCSEPFDTKLLARIAAEEAIDYEVKNEGMD